MKLEVGKTYRNGMGYDSTIIRTMRFAGSRFNIYPHTDDEILFVTAAGVGYREDGTFITSQRGRDLSDCNLLHEVAGESHKDVDITIGQDVGDFHMHTPSPSSVLFGYTVVCTVPLHQEIAADIEQSMWLALDESIDAPRNFLHYNKRAVVMATNDDNDNHIVVVIYSYDNSAWMTTLTDRK